ncbi:sensor histidine kinase KdpD [Blastococcus sp. URHD0036]|uniref:sensor histidine kinase n=1 Tax=Blastococcus sp. URHD0036 TaxID=1380356 RepID=UPI0004957A07|nr:HAMP domain-containing sensor histidine kinase [Blastococcus sp. URHD0036]
MADRRARSLRTRVAVAAGLGAVVLAVVVAAVLSALLTRREESALDRRLDAVTGAVAARVAAGADPADLLDPAAPLPGSALGGLVVTVRAADGTRTESVDGAAADLPARDGAAGGYRVRTAEVPGGTVTVGLPSGATDRAVARVRRSVVLGAALAVPAAAGLAWLLAGPALRPLRALRDRTAALGGRPGPAERAGLLAGPVLRSAETAEVAAALTGLLERVDAARADSERALAAARDFAAAAEHELRTPLTTLRTDIEVLAAHPDLPAAERAEVVRQLAATRERLEATLVALGRLAAGELTHAADPGGVELTDLVATAVAAAARAAPDGVAVTADLPAAEVRVPGSAASLRLATDNLLANALRHGGGRRVVAAVRVAGDRVLLTVDDDGSGVPADERVAVFDRFRRGRTARAPGSGLGLALVAQQASLHGGTASLSESPLGGTRAVLDLPVGPAGTPQTGSIRDA